MVKLGDRIMAKPQDAANDMFRGMRVFSSGDGWEEKINFVDTNNVFVGYDMAFSCCEYFGWFIATAPCKYLDPEGVVLGEEVWYEGYVFNTSWAPDKNTVYNLSGHSKHDSYTDTYIKIFQLVNAKGDKIYLHLYNHHNGLYSHGFEFRVDGELKDEGIL